MRGWKMYRPEHKLRLVLDMKWKAEPLFALGLACDSYTDEVRGCG